LCDQRHDLLGADPFRCRPLSSRHPRSTVFSQRRQAPYTSEWQGPCGDESPNAIGDFVPDDHNEQLDKYVTSILFFDIQICKVGFRWIFKLKSFSNPIFVVIFPS
ncbi:MAG: hypothetical protein WCD69_29820, partial [Xanthobacteraceae bacterium]